MGFIVPFFFGIVVVLMSLGALAGAAHRAVAVREQQAAQYLPVAQHASEAAFESAIATSVQGGRAIGPTFSASGSACGSTTMPDGHSCPYTYSSTGVVEGSGSASTWVVTGDDSCYDANTTLDETCVAMKITTTLTPTTRTGITAQRVERVTYRAMNAAPWVVVAGATETGSQQTVGEGTIEGCATSRNDGGCGNGTASTNTTYQSYSQCTADTAMNCSTQASQYRNTSAYSSGNYANGNQDATGWK